jgi:hypothetical protein
MQFTKSQVEAAMARVSAQRAQEPKPVDEFAGWKRSDIVTEIQRRLKEAK